MSSSRVSPTSPPKVLTRSNTTTSTTTVQLQLRRSISVENENGAATLALLAALVKNSNPNSIKQEGVGILENVKNSSNLNFSNLHTEKDCTNCPIINQQHVETLVLSTISQSSANNNNSNTNNVKSSSISQNLHHQIPSDILDDLASRFIINTPVDERQNLIRICFQIELAHWFYLDFFCGNEEKRLIPCGIKQFALHLFQHIPFLRNNLFGIDKILEDWKEYKLSVPTYGAILVSEDLKSVLLVQSYWAKSSWGFPKGKINEHEDPVHCATREVYEETGFDITNMIIPDHYIECVINYQYTRLYIIRNVSINTTFSPRTRKEIKCCEWFPLDSLPTTKNDPNCKLQLGINANSFFMIIPFMKRLKKWINDNRSGIERKYSSSSPITTFNNNNGCGNYYNNNSSGNYNYNSGNNGLVKQHSSTKKINLDIKKIGNCTSNNNNINNSNQLKGTINNSNNNNNNNNQKNKRQRHKSMGDIDGINLKLNFIKNNSNNIGSNNINRLQQSSGYDKNFNNSPPKNNCINKDNNDVKKCFFEDNTKYNSSAKHVNSKRQLFSCISTDGSTTTNNNNNNDKITINNNIINNNNSNKKDKDKNSLIFNNINNNNTNNKNGGNNNNNNNNNNVRSRTKSLGQNNNNINNLQSTNCSNGVQRKNSNENKDGGNMRKKSHNLQQQPQQQQQHQTQQQQQQQQSNESKMNRGPILQQQGHKETLINDTNNIKDKNNNKDNNNNVNNNIDSNNKINNEIIDNKTIINHHNFIINSCNNQQRQFMKLKQQHEELKAEQEIKNHINSQHIVTADNIKFNPNFDSWTNFSFTKNFIANVFC